MVAFSGRVEAAYTVPASTTVSVSSGALTSAVPVTWTAGTYYHTAAGTVTSGPTVLAAAINAAVSPYPDNASSMASAIGWGTWSAGWSFQIASGNDTGLFGGVTMTAVSSPTYRTAGPANGTDYAIGFNSVNDAFSAGDVYDVTGTDDLAVAWVGYIPSAPAGNPSLVSKYDGANGWQVYIEATTGNIRFQGVNGGGALFNADAGTGSYHAGAWHVGIATIDRATGKARVGTRSLAGTSYVSAEATTAATTTGGTATLNVGDLSGAPGTAPVGCYVSAFYIGVGSSVATGLSTNLSTALTNFANAVNSSFSVSLSTSTGLTTLSNSFWPCAITFASTNTRDLLGFAYDFDYPQTAAALATALGGYGDFTSGAAWLCNESSGDLAPVFGTGTLADSGTPTYSGIGARGGSDLAVGFDSSSDAFDGGDIFDVGASDDLVVVWGGRWSAAANRDIFCKYTGTTGWRISSETSSIRVGVADGVDTVTQEVSTLPVGTNYIGIVVLERATSKIRIAVHDLTSGTATVSSEMSVSAVGDTSNASSLTLGSHAGYWGNGSGHTVSYLAIATGSGVATGMSTNLSTILSSFATYMKSQTGTQQAKFLWFPDSPLNCDQHPSMAPEETDVRHSESPTGFALGLSGNRKYVHDNVRWDRVPVDRIREASATYDNASLEVFFRDAISGLGGHAWGGPCRDMQVYWSNAGTDTLLGADANSSAGVDGWRLVGASKFKDIAVPSQPGWLGAWNVRFGRLVSDG